MMPCRCIIISLGAIHIARTRTIISPATTAVLITLTLYGSRRSYMSLAYFPWMCVLLMAGGGSSSILLLMLINTRSIISMSAAPEVYWSSVPRRLDDAKTDQPH